MEYEKKRYGEKAAFAVYLFSVAGGLYLSVRFALPALLPFLLAAAVSAAFSGLSGKLTASKGRKKEYLSFLLSVTLTLALFAAVCYSAKRLLEEAVGFLGSVLSDEEALAGLYGQVQSALGPVFAKLGISAEGMLDQLIGEGMSGIADFARTVLGFLLSALPEMILFFFVTFLSVFYFTLGKKKTREAVKDLIGKGKSNRVFSLYRKFSHSLQACAKAYGTLFLIVFSCLFIGFLLLSQEYAMLFAAAIALLDLLPVIGTGTVLVPWGIVLLLTGNAGKGFGLLVLFALTTVLHEVLEPKLLGEKLGIPPLITLICLYAGYRLFGVWGMIASPVLFVAVRAGWDEELFSEKQE
ncbi:MAG: AI-2E family transporter [Clostridia bacterium]|nr:AI-2E family transporter [Clostridia bacterium]